MAKLKTDGLLRRQRRLVQTFGNSKTTRAPNHARALKL